MSERGSGFCAARRDASGRIGEHDPGTGFEPEQGGADNHGGVAKPRQAEQQGQASAGFDRAGAQHETQR